MWRLVRLHFQFFSPLALVAVVLIVVVFFQCRHAEKPQWINFCQTLNLLQMTKGTFFCHHSFIIRRDRDDNDDILTIMSSAAVYLICIDSRSDTVLSLKCHMVSWCLIVPLPHSWWWANSACFYMHATICTSEYLGCVLYANIISGVLANIYSVYSTYLQKWKSKTQDGVGVFLLL